MGTGNALGMSITRVARKAIFDNLSTEEVVDLLQYQEDTFGACLFEECVRHLQKTHPELFEAPVEVAQAGTSYPTGALEGSPVPTE